MVQLLESRPIRGQECVGIVELFQGPVLQHRHFVKVDDGAQLVCYGDDGVFGKLLADDPLDQLIRGIINTGGRSFRSAKGNKSMIGSILH